MKRILYASLFAVALNLCSCTNEPDYFFGNSSSERIEESLADFQFALRTRGQWVMEYFPGYDKDYGGWIYVVEFRENNTLKAWFEGSTFVTAENPVTESDYAVKFSTGTMLTFNTYNDYLHWFDYPGTNGGYQGYEGDHEFTLMSISKDYDEVMMRALKTGNAIRMTPLPEGYTPERYVEDVRASQRAISQTTLKVLANGKQVAVLTRANVFDGNDFSRYRNSKVWTISYTCRRQVKDVAGNLMFDSEGMPLYENIAVKDELSMICFADRSIRLYEPYIFKGEVIFGDEVIDFVNGEQMQSFSKHIGATQASDFYICTDSFIDFRLVP
ncbi:MAG: DUF4302 domain-containing protein [Bacteroidales bacterium]|nr:DUF4302 domain-containing protein [Bacteroidales bacterium]